MSIHIVTHERDRLVAEAEHRLSEVIAALDLLMERWLLHTNQAPASFIARIKDLNSKIDYLSSHPALADLEPEPAAPPSCPDCRSPRVVDINATTFGCAECSGLFTKVPA